MDDLSENTRASAPDLAPLCEALLALLFKEWSEYNKSMQMVRDILM